MIISVASGVLADPPDDFAGFVAESCDKLSLTAGQQGIPERSWAATRTPTLIWGLAFYSSPEISAVELAIDLIPKS
ncbi:hypothetical protein [Bradyrhizobium japonicum]|uniref:hypothetical protein n=1 Tax=Bradyrhizobium japonicum TaxID=375 RepID=UPI0004B41DA5|nr:hypothetical protein [Bradyrhizobium japonicum]